MFVKLKGTGKIQVVADALFYVGQQTMGIKTRSKKCLRVCNSRHDEVSEIVKLRIFGVHAADARYQEEVHDKSLSLIRSMTRPTYS